MPTIFDEESFLTRIHDEQMKATDTTKKLYYEMHKVMSPYLMRAIAEARNSQDTKLGAETLIAFVEYTASTIVALAGVMGGDGKEHQANREALARNLMAALQESFNTGLTRARKMEFTVLAEAEAPKDGG